jgi:primosomal protein DnaI
MEPLSQVLKQIAGPAAATEAEEKIRAVLRHELVAGFRARHPFLEDGDLRVNVNKLKQYIDEQAHCAQCPGLADCPNEFAGHYTWLEAGTAMGRGWIYDKKVPCRKWLAFQQESAIRRRVRSFYLPEGAVDAGYNIEEMLRADKDRAVAVKRIYDYVQLTIREGLQPKGLYLVGNFGTGKTYLMGYLLHELARHGYSGAIVYMPDFMEDLKNMLNEPQKLQETIELFKRIDLLVFDDIGAELLSPWARDHVLAAILNFRMNRNPTFYTSNHSLESLEQHFSFTNRDGEDEHKGRRLMERIAPFVDVVEVCGENKRGNK